MQKTLAERLKDLPAAQRERILAQLRQTKKKPQAPVIGVAERPSYIPLSSAQKQLWFVEQMGPNHAAYSIPMPLRLQGTLNTEALQASLHQLVQRHEVLRTYFVEHEGEPIQVVSPSATCDLTITELQTSQNPQQEANKLIEDEVKRPFDLTHAPLLRAHLYKLAADDHILLLNIHHIVFDAWSTDILLQELTQLYNAHVAGKPNTLDPLPIQYADFAIWQTNWLKSPSATKQLTYWQEQLAHIPPILPLPTDHTRPMRQTFQGQTHTFTLEATQTQQIKTLSQQYKVTPFMLLMSAFSVLLSRYSGQKDIVIGTPHANRNHKEIEPLIGYFINMLPIRFFLHDTPTFAQLLTETKKHVLDAYANQDLPFDKLVEAVQPERHLSHTPIFQVVFVWQNADDMSAPAFTQLTTYMPEAETTTSKFDITLSMEETEQTIIGTWEYNTDLFEPETIQRLTSHFVTLLQGIVEDEKRPFTHLPLLTSSEEKALLARATQGLSSHPAKPPLHEQFAHHARQTPHAIALSYQEEMLTYQQLEQKANQLAHYLQKQGVTHETLVCLYTERSIETIIGLLGILKAGGAYVPIDPAYPHDRIQHILEDSTAPLLLTQENLKGNLPQTNSQIVCLDADWSQIAQEESQSPPQNLATGDSLAYIIYTSGSTGKPKGVLVTHQNVSRLFDATQQWYQFNANDVWTLFHSPAFDFSVWEIWGALLYGAKLVIVPYFISRSPEDFYDLLHQQQVTVLNQTPSAFKQLIQVEGYRSRKHPFPRLNYIIFGGEALDVPSLKPWFEEHGDTQPQLVNMYGITETTVHVTYRPITWHDTTNNSSVIGQPIPDLEIYILDENQSLAPIGVPGEIYIGGAGVARGYKNRPELTAQRFIQNPFASGSSTLYRSGDLARLLPNNDIEYLGRIDHQVKIRGFRIELGEIETALVSHAQIQEVAVIVREDIPQDKRLVAYIINKEEALTTVACRQFLQDKLPEYMIPSAFVFLEQFPLTTNGKLNKRALPIPEQDRTDLGTTFVPPRTETEKTLSQIWSDVLDIEQVGIHDSFFELGGDSIRSIKVLAIAKKAGIHLSLPQLFQYQTIEALASLVATNTPSEEQAINEPFMMVSLTDRAQLPANVEDAYPLTMMQMGMLYHTASEADTMLYHNVSRYQIQAPFHEEAFYQALQSMSNRHTILRTSFVLGEYSQPLQLVHQRTQIPFEVHDLRGLADVETAVSQLLNHEKSTPFKWDTPPLIRFVVCIHEEQTFQLIMSEHHAILDGWSVATLFTELSQQYLTRLQSQTAPTWPALQSTYRDFVALEQQSLTSEASATYWQTQLAGIPTTQLPRWPQPYRTTPDTNSGTIERIVPETVAQQLRTLSQMLGVPLKTILLTAHIKVMSMLTHTQDVVTGLVSNSRPETLDGERILGLFLNTLPLVMQLSQGTWQELIQATFAQEQALLPHRRYPLAEIQRKLNKPNLFETAFNFVHFHVYEEMLSQEGFAEVPSDTFQETNYTLICNFNIEVASANIHLGLDYDALALSKEQVETISNGYLHVLSAMAQAEQPHHHHAFVTDKKQLQQLVGGASQPESLPSFPQSFEAQVNRTPQAIAVQDPNTTLTYTQLNEQANQLARYLQQQGVSLGSLVGICLHRTVDLLVSILAIHKVGGAYLPLDPTYPQARLAFMLEDAAVSCVVTSETAVSHLPPSYQATTLILEQAQAPIQAQATQNLDVSIPEQSLAYIIYTSGSTGQPKGAMLTHQGLAHYLQWCLSAYEQPNQQGAPVHASIGFDATITSLFPPLLSGQQLYMIPENNIHHLADHLKTKPAGNLVKITPAHLELLASTLSPEEMAQQAQTFVIGGEALLASHIAKWQKLAPKSRYINEYGPTETVVGCSTYTITSQTEIDGAVPIGRPIDNMQLHILDPYLNPVSVGAIGEIYIGGSNMARGYLNRPALTAERFIPHPSALGQRLYKTGDLAQYLPNGDILFLGRIDNQVKLRGYRIELGEIEAVLTNHPTIQEVAVILWATAGQEPQLIAYYTTESQAELQTQELKQYLLANLPAYMVPRAFIPLQELPLTANGKIDRPALPAPTKAHLGIENSYVAPQDALETQLQKIWQEVLDITPISMTDDFFELGGHSLSAMRLTARMNAILEQSLPLSILAQHPTILALAKELRQNSSINWSPIVPLQTAGSLPPIFAIHPVGGLVHSYQPLAKVLGNDQPFYGVQAFGSMTGQTPLPTVAEMAEIYADAIYKIQPEGPFTLLGWSLGGLIAFEVAQQLQRQGLSQLHLVLLDTYILSRIPQQDVLDDTNMVQEFIQDFLHADMMDNTWLQEILAEKRPLTSTLNSIWQQARATERLPEEITLAQLKQRFHLFRANLYAGWHYQPQPYTGTATLVCASTPDSADASVGWKQLIHGALDIHQTSGTHYTLMQPPHITQTAQLIQTQRLNS